MRRDAEHTSANDHALEATAGGAELPTGALGLLLHVAAMVAVMAVVALVVYKAGRDRPAQRVDQPRLRVRGASVLAGVLTLFT